MDLAALLQTITAALLLGAGKLLLDVKTAVAVHDERLGRHSERIERLEEKQQNCTH